VLLWVAPFAALLAGAIGLIMFLRRRRVDEAPGATLSADEQQRVAELLERPKP
jgi:cytochrome c-type biogenesis protein CcmH/NrfF